jgi:hypothetical protein
MVTPSSKQNGLLKKNGTIIFLVILLIVVNLIRSEVLIDTSLLPRMISLGLLLVFTFLLLYKKIILPKPQIWLVLLIGFYIWNLTSLLWSVSPSEGIAQTQLFFMCIGLFILISYFDNASNDFALSYVRIHSLVLLYSFILAFYRINSIEFYDPYQVHSISMNNNLYAGFLLLSLPILIWGYSLQKGDWKILTLLTIILTVFFLIIVQSRAAYMGLLLSISIISLITLLRYRQVFNQRNLVSGALALTLLIGLLYLFYQQLDGTRRNAFMSKVAVWKYFYSQEKTAEVADYYNQALQKQSGQSVSPLVNVPVEYYENVNSRLIFWKKSFGLIRQHTLIGIGTANWKLNIASITQPENPDYTQRNYTYSQPHNEWIAFLSETGVFGLLFVFILLILPVLVILIRSVLNYKKKEPFEAIIITSFLTGFYVFASFDFPFRRVEHMVILFSLLAFLFNRTSYFPHEIRILSNPRILRILKISFIFLLMFTIYITAERIRGEFFTLRVFQNERRNDDAVIYNCDRAKNKFYIITPNALAIDWFKGVAQFRNGDNKNALISFKSALRSTPYEVRLLNDYSVSLFGERKYKEAISILKHAYIIDPHFDEAKFNLCAIYYSISMPDSALFYLEKCRESQKKNDYFDEIKASAH